MDVWLNGQFISADDASLSIFDAGLQHGIGLFETMAAANGRVFRAEAHVKRLIDSARQLRLSERLQVEPLVEAVQLAVTHNKVDRARIRLTVTGGNLNMLQSTGASPHDPTILVVVRPPTDYPDTFFEGSRRDHRQWSDVALDRRSGTQDSGLLEPHPRIAGGRRRPRR